jgi:hypothetical protein
MIGGWSSQPFNEHFGLAQRQPVHSVDIPCTLTSTSFNTSDTRELEEAHAKKCETIY